MTDDLDRYLKEQGMGRTYRKEVQPLFDTLIVPESGIVQNVALFTNTKHFPDGSCKIFRKHHNFTCEGFLGHPLSYRLNALEICIEKFSNPDDILRTLKALTLRFVLGQNTTILTATGATLRPYLSGGKEESKKLLAEFPKNGVWLHYRQEMEPQIIESVTAFRVEVEAEIGELRGPVWIKVIMQDTLIKPM